MNDLYQIRYTKQMGRGVFAKKQIEVDTNLLYLDRRKFLMYRIVAEHNFFGKLVDFRQVNMKVHFAFYLTFANKYRKYEKNHSPKTIRYINNLPKKYHSLICWNEDQLKMIENKELVEKAVQKRKKVYQDFLKVKKFLQESSQDNFIFSNYSNDDQDSQDQEEQFTSKKLDRLNQSDETQPDEESENIDPQKYKQLCGSISFEGFLNFYTAVETRHIYQQNHYDSKSELGALAPVLEMFNHCPQGQVKEDTYFLKVIKKIQKDEQIFVSYGDRDNQNLLLNYGFVIDDHFYKIKNEYVSKTEPLLNSNTNQQTCSQFRSKLAKKYNQLFIQKQQLNKQIQLLSEIKI